MYTPKLSDQQIKQAHIMYMKDSCFRVLSEFFGVSQSCLRDSFIRHNLPLLGPCRYTGQKRKYNLDTHYFDEINTSNKAYFLGLLLADGNVATPKPTWESSVLTLNLKDRCLIEAFKKDMRSGHPIKTYKKDIWTFVIHSKRLGQSFAQHGLVPRKTLKIEFPTTVPERWYSHLIRGYFDGDGCVYTTVTREGWSRCRVEFAGTYAMMSSIRNIIGTQAQALGNKIALRSNTYRLKYGKLTSVIKIRDYMYYEAKVFLPRKRAILDSLG